MERRNFISATSINKMIYSTNARKREQARQELICRQHGTEKELPPTYEILHVAFDSETRVTRIEIQQSQKYRTIERYVTQNYVRHPIYSNWKTRTKSIKKTLKLTNQELENLNHHPEPLISSFAEEIIASIGKEELFPSWLIRSYLEKEYAEKVKTWENEEREYYSKINAETRNHSMKITKLRTNIKEQTKILNKKILKKDKLKTKIKKIGSASKSLAKSIFTLFIYNYLSSEHRKQKLLKKQTALNGQIKNIEYVIQENELLIAQIKNKIQTLKNDYAKKKETLNTLKQQELSTLSDNLTEIEPLPCQISYTSGFTPLKNIVGLAYEKIVGCYIVHNKEKDKFYVGQSKDVIKRLKQHFKGTVPNNIIFAEDYYSSAMDRSDLFEVKILPCTTKDELDRTEKMLIEKYDAFKSGYNGTKGNI